ncbi:Cyclochlorotine biosynthesis protein O [Colletotrichum siamense]|nr:Cyclochlorotine biosynthesis protein O [Colletotrichum siamense]
MSLEDCGKRLSPWSPGLEAVNYYRTMFPSDFRAPSPYRGPPSKELDDAWDLISDQDLYLMRMDREDLRRINKSEVMNTAWGYSYDQDPNGVKYIFEVFHQLHCLNIFRKYTWPDHYELAPPGHEDDAAWRHVYYREHIDHCIESFRLSIMCRADVTPLTGNIRPGNDHVIPDPNDPSTLPEPDFMTQHTCRDFEKIRQFASERKVPRFDQPPGST